MRFKLDKPLTEKDYNRRRTITKFLWFPKKINYEVRWLESVMFEQVVDYNLVSDPDEIYTDYRLPLIKHYYWRDIKWVDLPPNLQ